MSKAHMSSMASSGSEVLWTVQREGYGIEVLRGHGVEFRRREAELLGQGVAVPFGSRLAATSLREFTPSVFVAILNSVDRCVGGFAVQARPAQFLPGHRLLRIEQFGSSIPIDAADAVIGCIVDWVRNEGRVLRLSVDVFSFDGNRRQTLARMLDEHGFRRAKRANGYTETLVIDLARSEDELFKSLHHSARRKIRQLEKHPLVICPVADVALSQRMNQLLHETYQRTGGSIPTRDWAARIELSRNNPELSRIVGLFRTDMTGPESLLAYAWGCHGGDHVFYSEAASTRDTGEQRIALAYGVMWDLILWAKRTGARVFDLGGVTRGTLTDEDPLGGISDFKRYFSQEVVQVREEWILDDHSWRASLAAAVHRRIRPS